ELMGFIVLSQLRGEFLAVFGRWIFVVVAKVSLNWTMNIDGAFEPRRNIAAPGASCVAGIKTYRGFEFRVGCGCLIDHPAAHAKADNADAFAIYGGMVLQKLYRCVDIRDDAPIAEALAAGARIVLRVGT